MIFILWNITSFWCCAVSLSQLLTYCSHLPLFIWAQEVKTLNVSENQFEVFCWIEKRFSFKSTNSNSKCPKEVCIIELATFTALFKTLSQLLGGKESKQARNTLKEWSILVWLVFLRFISHHLVRHIFQIYEHKRYAIDKIVYVYMYSCVCISGWLLQFIECCKCSWFFRLEKQKNHNSNMFVYKYEYIIGNFLSVNFDYMNIMQ